MSALQRVFAGKPADMAVFDVNHALWCKSESWTEKQGAFAHRLVDFIEDEGWRHPPPNSGSSGKISSNPGSSGIIPTYPAISRQPDLDEMSELIAADEARQNSPEWLQSQIDGLRATIKADPHHGAVPTLNGRISDMQAKLEAIRNNGVAHA